MPPSSFISSAFISSAIQFSEIEYLLTASNSVSNTKLSLPTLVSYFPSMALGVPSVFTDLLYHTLDLSNSSSFWSHPVKPPPCPATWCPLGVSSTQMVLQVLASWGWPHLCLSSTAGTAPVTHCVPNAHGLTQNDRWRMTHGRWRITRWTALTRDWACGNTSDVVDSGARTLQCRLLLGSCRSGPAWTSWEEGQSQEGSHSSTTSCCLNSLTVAQFLSCPWSCFRQTRKEY